MCKTLYSWNSHDTMWIFFGGILSCFDKKLITASFAFPFSLVAETFILSIQVSKKPHREFFLPQVRIFTEIFHLFSQISLFIWAILGSFFCSIKFPNNYRTDKDSCNDSTTDDT